MKKLVCGIAILLALPFSKAQEIPMDPNVKTGVLENGLTYYVLENEKPKDKVELRLAINAGSVLEDEDQRGLAHFMEHMNFNGTKNFPDNELVDFLQTLGIKFGQHLNAYTSFDETVYMLPVPLDKPDNLDKGLLVLEDWAFNATLTDEQIDKERGVVLEELRTGLGAEKRMLDQYLPKVLHGSKYADRLPIGTENSLKNFTYEALRRFHKDWYRPDLMAVIVVGDINADEVVAKIKKNFGKYKNPEKPRNREVFYLKNHEDTKVEVVKDKEASFSSVNFYFKSDENYEPKNTVQEFMKNMVEGMATNMINNRIQELVDSNDPPFTYGYVFKAGTWARTKEALQGMAMAGEGKQKEALKVLLEETNRAIQYGFTPSEFERTKKEIMSRQEASYNNRNKVESRRKVGSLVSNFLEKTPAPSTEWSYDMYKQMMPMIPLKAVNEFVKSWQTEGNKVVVIKGPDKEGITMPDAKDVAKLVTQVQNQKLSAYQDAEQIKSLLDKEPKAGKVSSTATDDKLGITTWTLSNGSKVTYKKTDFKDDEIMFKAYSPGGKSMLSDEEYKSTNYVYSSLNEAGVNGKSLSEINQYMNDKNASLNIGLRNTSETVSGSSTKADLEVMLQMLHANFTALNFDQEAYDARFKKMNGFMKNLKSQPGFYFSLEHSKFMQKGNPRYMEPIPTEESWSKQNFQNAYNYYTERLADADDFHFFFVGNVDPTTLKPLVEKYIASLPSKPEVEDQYIDNGFRQPTGPMVKKYYKGEDDKSQVRISIAGETKYKREELLAMRALQEVVKIKLTEKLREEEAGVYGTGVRTSLSNKPYGSFSIGISFTCAPENVDKLSTIALEELRKVASEGPEQKDLEKFIEGELNDHKDNMQRNKYWMTHLVEMMTNERPADAILNYDKELKKLTAKDVQKLAKKYATQPEVIAILLPEKMKE